MDNKQEDGQKKINSTPEEILKNSINKIIHADNIEFLKSLPDECIDFIFADPPYNLKVKKPLVDFRKDKPLFKIYLSVTEAWDNIGDVREYTAYSKKWLAQCRRVLKPNGGIMVIGCYHCIYTIGHIMSILGYQLVDDIIWRKGNAMPTLYAKTLKHLHETIVWARKNTDIKSTFNYYTAKQLGLAVLKDLRTKGQLGSIWDFNTCIGYERLKAETGERLHPTQKPLSLMETILTIATKTGDLVLDPFGGTGTTATMAKIMGRRFISIEKEKKYIAPSIKRVAEAKRVYDSQLYNSYWDINRKEHIIQEKKNNKSLFDK